MKLLDKKVKVSYVNPIEEWYERYTVDHYRSKYNIGKYDNGMLISISNKELNYETIIGQFKDIYISILKACKGKGYRFSKWDLKRFNGYWEGEQIVLPSKEKLLDVISKKIPIMIGGIHNYKKEDARSCGKEYCHTHIYLYNIHHHLPNANGSDRSLRNIEDKIERHLQRYTNTRKRLQNIIRITPVGVGAYKFTDTITPTKLYEYLRSPIDNPDANNLMNYISNNRHLPSIQYPLAFVHYNHRID